MTRLLLLLAMALCDVLAIYGDTIPPENSRPLTSTYHVSLGGMSALSTYLSPIMHSGTSAGLGGEWSRRLRCDRYNLSQSYSAAFGMGFLSDPHARSAMSDVHLALSWHIRRNLSPLPGLAVGLGAGVSAEGGLLYLPRNSNNPVAARVSVDMTLNASAVYAMRIGRLPLRLIEQVSLPSLGVFFSPHYGQSYYEIYLGERSGLARCGWWGNHFGINNLCAVEIPVCGIRLRLGYALEVRSSLASGINTRITAHQCVLGISTDWINVTRMSQ